jgi:WD40 repeat protein
MTLADLEVGALADIGRYEDAIALAHAIESSAEASPAARTEAERAASIAAAASTKPADANTAQTAMRDLYAQAVRADASGEHASARDLFERAWSVRRPNAAALYGAAVAARATNDRASAQRFFDRALEDLERAHGAPVSLVVEEGADTAAGSLDWSTDGSRILARDAYSDEVTIFDASSLRVKWRGHTNEHGVSADMKEAVLGADGAHDVRVVAVDTGLELLRVTTPVAAPVAALTPDGALLLTPDDDTNESLVVWDVAMGREVGRLDGVRRKANDVLFAADGARQFLATTEGTWELPGGAIVRGEGHKGTGHHIVSFANAQILGDGHTVLADDMLPVNRGPMQGTARWDLRGNGPIARDKSLVSGSRSHDATRALARVRYGTQLVDTSNGAILVDDQSGHGARFSLDGRVAAFASTGAVRVVDASSGREVWRANGGDASAVAFSPDGRSLAVSRGSELAILDATTGAIARRATPPRGGHTGMAAIAKGARRAAIEGRDGLTLVDLTTGAVVRRLPFTSDRKIDHFVFGTEDVLAAVFPTEANSNFPTASVALWRGAADDPVLFAMKDEIDQIDVHFSRDGSRLCTAGMWGTFQAIDVASGKVLTTDSHGWGTACTRAVEIRKDADGVDVPAVIDTANGNVVNVMRPNDPVRKGWRWADESSDGKTLWMASDDAVGVLDVDTAALLGRWQRHDDARTVIGSPDAHALAFPEALANMGTKLTVVDAMSGRDRWSTTKYAAASFVAPLDNPGFHVGWSPESRYVFLFDKDNTLDDVYRHADFVALDAATGAEALRMRIQNPKNNPASWTRGDEGVLVGGDEGMYVWSHAAGRARARALKRDAVHLVVGDDDRVDVLGGDDDDRRELVALLGCGGGWDSLPFDACAERFMTPGLLGAVARGDASFREP